MFNPLPAVLADMRRASGGVVAVVLLIAVAVALGVGVSAQERGLRQGSAAAADAFDLLVGAPGSPTQLVLSTIYLQPEAVPLIDGGLIEELEADPGVAYAAPLGFGDSYAGRAIIGTTPDLIDPDGGAMALAEGRPFERLSEAVVGADVGLAPGDRFTPLHGVHEAEVEEGDAHGGVAYEVVGRLSYQGTPWDRAILVPIESVWDVHGLATGHGAGEPERLGPPWPEAVPGVPAIVVEPRSIADAYRLRGAYRTARRWPCSRPRC